MCNTVSSGYLLGVSIHSAPKKAPDLFLIPFVTQIKFLQKFFHQTLANFKGNYVLQLW